MHLYVHSISCGFCLESAYFCLDFSPTIQKNPPKKTGVGWQRDMRWEHKLLFLASREPMWSQCEANVCISRRKLPQLDEGRGSCGDMLCYEREFATQVGEYYLRCLCAWGDIEFQSAILQQNHKKTAPSLLWHVLSSLFVNGFNLEREKTVILVFTTQDHPALPLSPSHFLLATSASLICRWCARLLFSHTHTHKYPVPNIMETYCSWLTQMCFRYYC